MKISHFALMFLALSSTGFGTENWVNRIGNQICQPSLYYAPNNLEELCDNVKNAVSQGHRVHAIGNGYSISDVGCTNGCLINLKHLNRILDVDQEKKLIRVETGITLQELNEQLATHGLTISNQAAIAEISLGGALSTGVHGTGHTGSLSSFLKEIELITADGSIHKINLESDEEAFCAASVSLGSLGIIYAVTLQCESLFYVMPVKETQNIENMLANYKMFHKTNDFFQFFWNVEDGQVNVRRWNRCELSDQMNNSLTQPIPAYKALPWYSMDVNDKNLFAEIAIPVDYLPQALQELKQLVLKYKELGAEIQKVNVRFVEADKHAYLSPCSDRATAYIALCILEEDKYLAFYKEFEEMMFSFQGRPHWGKVNFLDYKKVASLYGPNLQKFIEVKHRLDPNNVFSNSFTDRILNNS